MNRTLGTGPYQFLADKLTKLQSEVGPVTLTIIGSVPTKILDIPASLSDVMNQLKKINISLAGFMAIPPTPPSKLVSF